VITKNEFVKAIFFYARKMKFKIQTNKNNQEQIDFGNKTLTSEHLSLMYPDILQPDADIPKIINKVAPGRPCTHKPMKEIVTIINAVE